MSEHAGNPVRNRQAEPEPALLIVVEFIQPPEFLEDLALLVRRNAGTGIPDFDAETAAASPATEQHVTVLGVANGVGKEILQHPPQQLRIGMDHMVAIRGAQSQPAVARQHGQLGNKRCHHLVQRKMLEVRLLRTGIEPRNVEQPTEQILAGDERGFGLTDQRRCG